MNASNTKETLRVITRKDIKRRHGMPERGDKDLVGDERLVELLAILGVHDGLLQGSLGSTKTA